MGVLALIEQSALSRKFGIASLGLGNVFLAVGLRGYLFK